LLDWVSVLIENPAAGVATENMDHVDSFSTGKSYQVN